MPATFVTLFDLAPKHFIFRLFQFFHMQVLLSLSGRPLDFSSLICALSSSFIWWLLFLAISFLVRLSLAPLLTSGSSRICSLLLHSTIPSLSFLLSFPFSPCHHLFSITLLSGWLMLETFQEFLIENTMRTVITSVSPEREPGAWGG